MKSFELEPIYSKGEVPGKCIKCLGEQELNSCLMQMLRYDVDDDVKEKYEALVTFLKSPESERLRIESENHMADGKNVSVIISYQNGKPEYELKIK
ncbi:hypothetical protein ACFLV1_01250 [Chloroflexota bacterium]